MITAKYIPHLFIKAPISSYNTNAHKLFDKLPLKNRTAHNLFDELPLKNPSAHNPFDKLFLRETISKYPQLSLLKLPNYANALCVCAQTADLRNGRTLHALAVVNGFSHRPFIANCVMEMYSRCRMINDAKLVFDHIGEVNDASWDCLFGAYIRIGWPEVASNVLVWMHRAGAKLDSSSLDVVLNSGLDNLEESRMLLNACVVKVALDLDFLVDDADSEGLDEGIEILNRNPNRCLVVFNALVTSFSLLATDSSADMAMNLFSEMHRRRMDITEFSLKCMLECCKVGFGTQIHAQLIKTNYDQDECIGIALIKMYGSSNHIEDSFKVIESTTNQDALVGSMIQAYVQNGHLEKAMILFQEMLCVRLKPDQGIVSSLFKCSGHFGTVVVGQVIQCYAVKTGLDQFINCQNSQILMYFKCGIIDSAIKTVSYTSWLTLILSHAFHGCVSDALEVFDKMKECEVMPNGDAFLAVLTACGRGGLVEQGFRYLQSMMIDYAISSNPSHYACIINALGRRNRLDEALYFVSNSIFADNIILWQALYRACIFHQNRSMVIHTCEKLIQLDPYDPAPYITLSNLYFKTGEMSLAMRIRGQMREKGVFKNRDVIWMEIGPSVKEFTDGSMKLKEMLEAVSVSVPVRVMMSTRISEECHGMLKIVSEKEGREVVVRDSEGFHRFRNGVCSCADYW